MLYYFSILSRHPKSCNGPATEVRRAVAVEAEDSQVAHLHACLDHEFLLDAGFFQCVQISKLHYETICADLEIEVEA